MTHDQEIALAISDRVAIMDRDGGYRQIGAPDEIYENPWDVLSSDSWVFLILFPVEMRKGRLYVKGAVSRMETSRFRREEERKGHVAGCRPSDIVLSRDETGERRGQEGWFFSGPIDYRIETGGQEIRVQQDTQEALAQGLLFSEGETCVFSFTT